MNPHDVADPGARRRGVLVFGFRGAIGTGLRDVIAADPELQVTGPADRRDIRGLITAHRPDVVLIDQAALSSVMELRRLVVAYPRLGIVVAVLRVSRRRDESLLAAGARIVVPLTVEPAELRGALKLVARGLVGPPRVARPTITKDLDRLTEREHQVFELIVRGRSAREISTELQISGATANTHTRRVYEKLGVHSRAELMAYAAELGGVDDPLEDRRRSLSRDRTPFGRRACESRNAGRPSSADWRAALGVGRWSHPS